MTKKSHPHLGKILRAARHKKGLSLKQVGIAINSDSSTVSRWESGASFVSHRRFFELLKHLGLTPEEFFAIPETVLKPIVAKELTQEDMRKPYVNPNTEW